MMTHTQRWVPIWIGLVVFWGASFPVAGTASTEVVSVSSAGILGDAASNSASISGDGRYVAFHSSASNLVAGDTNGYDDVFVHDRQTGATTRVSESSAGVQGNDFSRSPSISGDGRYVAFDSAASNLVTGDTNSLEDIFVHDRQTGATTRVSLSSAGTQGSDNSSAPSISADGRYVAFYSAAANLVVGDTNDFADTFVRDRQTSTTTRVSVSSVGTQGNGDSGGGAAISGDGRYVAFDSEATNLVAGDTNHNADTFVHDRQAGVTTRVSVSSAGTQADGSEPSRPSISADGRYVAFDSAASNLVAGDTNSSLDAFVHDRQTGATTRVSVSSAGVQGNGESGSATISGNGRYVAFDSSASNFVAGDTNSFYDTFVFDRQAAVTTRISLSSTGAQANGNSGGATISSEGRFVGFTSQATNFVPGGDNNGARDVFVHETKLFADGFE